MKPHLLYKMNRRNKCPHHGGEICLYGDPQDKTPNHKTKVNSLKDNGNKAVMPMEIVPGKAKGQLHQLQDPSNLGKSHYNVINGRGWGPYVQRMCLTGGHRLEGLKWGYTTSREEEGLGDSQTKLSNHGVLKRGGGEVL